MSHPLSASNQQLLPLWLHGRSPHTVACYQHHAKAFLLHISKPLEQVTLVDIQAWQLSLSNLSPSSQQTAIAVIKSLLSFAHQSGVLSFNVGKLARAPKVPKRLSERILSESQVQAMLGLETKRRNRAILLLLYSGGLRVSELCGLKWRDFQSRDDGGQVTVFGKGGKTRVVLIPTSVWQEVYQLRGDAGLNDPVFRSRERGKSGTYHLSRKQVYRIVKAAAHRAGIEGNVSPHWLRHSHASHSLDKGAPINLVQQTLGHSTIAITEKYLHAKPTDSSAMYLGH